ncbi:hypothetical protein ACP70R_012862 [Stipagrostis hirtigluma subsp. patula]
MKEHLVQRVFHIVLIQIGVFQAFCFRSPPYASDRFPSRIRLPRLSLPPAVGAASASAPDADAAVTPPGPGHAPQRASLVPRAASGGICGQ